MIDVALKLVGGLCLVFMWFAVIMTISITIGKLAGHYSPYKDIK